MTDPCMVRVCYWCEEDIERSAVLVDSRVGVGTDGGKVYWYHENCRACLSPGERPGDRKRGRPATFQEQRGGGQWRNTRLRAANDDSTRHASEPGVSTSSAAASGAIPDSEPGVSSSSAKEDSKEPGVSSSSAKQDSKSKADEGAPSDAGSD
jgi:hypothetical protein